MKSSGKASMHRMICHRLLSTQSWPHHTLVRKACGQRGLRAGATQQSDPHPRMSASHIPLITVLRTPNRKWPASQAPHSQPAEQSGFWVVGVRSWQMISDG